MPKIIIDAGHVDNTDPGAVANNTTEHAEVKRLALYIMEKLPTLPEFSGYTFDLVPTNKTLTEKIAYINATATNKDYAVSLHMNSATASATGIQTYYLTESQSSRTLASRLQSGLVSILGLRDRGIFGDTTNRHGRLGFVRDTVTTSFLLELGFITNINDLTVVHRIGGDAVIEGLRRMLDLQAVSSVDLTELKNLQTTFDTILKQGQALTTQEQALLASRKEWDMRMDKVRGLILAEIEKKKPHLPKEFVNYEQLIIKEYAIANNDLIAKLEGGLILRDSWDKNMTQVRKDEKKYFSF